MIKRFIIAIVLLAVVVGGIVGFNMFRDQAIQNFFANMPVAPSPVTTVKVEPVTWTPDIQAIGTVGAARGVDLTVEATGIVQELRFTSNQKVTEGEVLVQLDDTVQKADLAAQQSQAALDKQTLDRALELRRRGVGADTSVETAQAAATASGAQLEKLQAVLDQKQLKAPFSGTVGIPRVEVGQYVTPGITVATLQDLDTLRADFSVPEQSLGLLNISQAVRFGLDASAFPFSGKIIGIEPKVDPVTRLVLVRAEIENPDGRLSPGQFVQVRVSLPAEADIVAVPQTAVVASLYGGYVYAIAAADAQPAADSAAAPAVESTPAAESAPAAEASPPAAAQPGQIARQIFVKTGRRSGGLVEIAEGLKPGDEIVTSGQNRLSNNAPVTVDNTVQPNPSAANQEVSR